MTVTFKVSQVKEEDVNMNNIESFDINEFIKGEINGLIEDKKYYHLELMDKYMFEGMDKNDAFVLAKEEKLKLDNQREELIKSKIENAKVLKSSFADNEKEYLVGDYNSFVYSAWRAYNQHHHLEIRPENIWMSIITQFTFYVSKNSEILRDKFVDFQGKQTLEVFTDYPILDAPFDKLTLDMTNQIQKSIKDPLIKDWIVPNFSTTTETDKVVFSVALMSTMKKYFRYKMSTKCGLPEVTLHGTASDWLELKEKVLKLKEFDNNTGVMGKWVNHLLPVMDNFIQSVNGTPDVDWWNKIIDVHSQSGGSIISGWLSVFCVFNDEGDYEDNVRPMGGRLLPGSWPKISEKAIANGYVSVPVLLTDFDGTQYNSQLYAGHFSSKIDKSKINPSLNWFIVSDISV